jgi:hypothetical protein
VNIRKIVVWAAVVGVMAFPGGSGAEPSESKKKRIRELLAISGVAGMEEQMADQHAYIELMRIQPSYSQMMQFAVSEQTDLSEQDRQRLMGRLEKFEPFAERFRELFLERVDFSKIIESVYLPLYSSYFTLDDLEKMIVFYRTPVGRKAIEVMPALMQEAGRGVDEAVRPQVVALIQEIVAEQRAKLKD